MPVRNSQHSKCWYVLFASFFGPVYQYICLGSRTQRCVGVVRRFSDTKLINSCVHRYAKVLKLRDSPAAKSLSDYDQHFLNVTDLKL